MKIEDVQFNKNFETEGIWWLPGHRDNFITGKLTYNHREGLTLETLGDFSPQEQKLPDFDASYQKVIHGQSKNGILITLSRCYRTNYTVSFGGLSSQKFRPLDGFFGSNIDDPSTMKFEIGTFSATNFESWYGELPIKESQDDKSKIVLEFTRPKSCLFYLESFKSKIKTHNVLNMKSEGWFDRTWVYRSFINFIPDEKQDYFWFVEHSAKILNFLTLMTGVNSKLTSLRLTIDKKMNKEKFVYVIYSQDPNENFEKDISFHHMLLGRPHIGTDLPKVLNSWARDTVALGPVHDLFFSVIAKPDMYVQSQFLHLMQAIETYHRRTYEGKYLNSEDFAKALESLKSAIPEWISPEFQQVLRGKMSFMNELSLRSRLKILFSGLPTELVQTFIGDSKRFLQNITQMRDQLTHYSNSEGQLDTQHLYDCTLKLEVVVAFLILRRLELPEDKIISGLKRKYRHVADNNRKS